MAKQKLLEHCKISPPQPNSSSPTNFSFPLTFFDFPWLLFPPRNPLFFFEYSRPTSHFLSSTLPNLKHSLSLTLQHFLPFPGTLIIPPPPNKPHIEFNHDNSDHHVPMTIMESDGDFNHLSASHPREASIFHSLVPDLGSKHLLAVQVTVFPSFGLAMGFAYHHVLGDERTFNNFLKTWALLCRDSSSSIETYPSYDRKIMIRDNQGLESTFLKDYRKRISTQNYNKVSLSNLVRATFLVTPSDMERIKNLILDQCKRRNYSSKSMHLSPYVLTCAFIWVCLIKSKNDGLDWNHPNYFGFIAGGLTRFDSPVPKSYVGNCVGFGRATMMTNELLGEAGIVAAAREIGRAIKVLDEEFLRGADKWISDWEALIGSELHVAVTGSPKVNLYETDFGWGLPKKIEEVSIDKMRGISLTESRNFKGGIEVGLALPREEMETFSSFFHRGLNVLQ